MNFCWCRVSGCAVSLSLTLHGLISNVWDPSVDNLSELLVTILWCWRGERGVANNKPWICSLIMNVLCISLTSKTPADSSARDNWRMDEHQPGQAAATCLVARLHAAEDWRVLLLPRLLLDVFPQEKHQRSDLCTLGPGFMESEISLSTH